MFKQLIDLFKGRLLSNKDSNFNSIVQALESQLETLQDEYKRLQTEHEILTKKVKTKNKKIRELEKKINELTNVPLTIDSNDLIFTNINLNSSPIEILNSLITEGKIQECGVAAEKFVQKVNPKVYSLEGIRSLSEFLTKVFTLKPTDPKEIVGLYLACLKIMHRFFKNEIIKQFIFQNEKLINKAILKINEPHLTTNLAKIYFIHHESKLAPFLDNLYSLVDSSFQEMDFKDYIKLLWYSVYVNKEDHLLGKNGELLQLEQNKQIPEIQLFSLYKKMKNSSKKVDSSIIENLLGGLSVFNNTEKKKLSKLLHDIMDKIDQDKKQTPNIIPKANTVSRPNKSLRKIAFITKLQSGINQEYIKNLRKEFIELALYSDPLLKKERGYLVVDGWTDIQKGKTYIKESEIGPLKKKIGSKWIDIRAFDVEEPTIKKVNLNNRNQSYFAWPSTDLKGGYEKDKITNFNEESELKKLGYQITGLTREKRWKVLKTAVVQLGLKRLHIQLPKMLNFVKGKRMEKRNLASLLENGNTT